MTRTQKLTHMAMLLALTVVLSIFEASTPMFIPIAGVKLGIANVAVMYALLFYGKKEALVLNIAKSTLAATTRGVMAGILSLSGSLLSIIVIIILVSVFKDKLSIVIISISGAIFHNIGQLIAVYFILDNYNVFYYLPILLVSGVIMGIFTGILLKALIPVFSYIPKKGLKKWRK